MVGKAQGKHWYLYWYKSISSIIWNDLVGEHVILIIWCLIFQSKAGSLPFLVYLQKNIIKDNNESKNLISQNSNTIAESLLYFKEIPWKKYVSVVRSSFCTRSTELNGTAQELITAFPLNHSERRKVVREVIIFEMFSILFHSSCFAQINVCGHHCESSPTVLSLWAPRCSNALIALLVAASWRSPPPPSNLTRMWKECLFLKHQTHISMSEYPKCFFLSIQRPCLCCFFNNSKPCVFNRFLRSLSCAAIGGGNE